MLQMSEPCLHLLVNLILANGQLKINTGGMEDLLVALMEHQATSRNRPADVDILT